MWTLLWITLPAAVWGWGDLGHRLIAEHGSRMADPSALSNCHVTVDQLVAHVTDPDRIWRTQRIAHPHEGVAHFFHVDSQPGDWRKRKEAQNRRQGFLVYRIADWIDEAKKLRAKQDWPVLAERLYGLAHYLGDLTQPLHLSKDYDGDAAGLPGLHSQFETKMLNRYENEIMAAVKTRLSSERIPALWPSLSARDLVFDVAQQSFAKADRLFASARPALQAPKSRKKRKKPPSPRFVKAALWEGTGAMAADQLALGARLWAHVLNSVCR
jgi:hypothetical protein